MFGWSFPNIQESVVTPDFLITPAWRRFLQQIWDGTNARGQPIVGVTPGVSPWTYTAIQRGNLYISGGIISSISFSRGGTSVPTGVINGVFPVQQGDGIVVAYSAVPAVNFVPG